MATPTNVFQFDGSDMSLDKFDVSVGEKTTNPTGWSRPIRFRASEDKKSVKYATVDLSGCYVVGDHGASVLLRRPGQKPERKKWAAEHKLYEVSMLIPSESKALKFFQDLERVATEAISKAAKDLKYNLMPVCKKSDNGEVWFVTLTLNSLSQLFVPGLVQEFTPVNTLAKNPLPKGSRLRSAFINPMSVSIVRKDGINKAYINFGCAFLFAMKPQTGDEKLEAMAQGNEVAQSIAAVHKLSKAEVFKMMGIDEIVRSDAEDSGAGVGGGDDDDDDDGFDMMDMEAEEDDHLSLGDDDDDDDEPSTPKQKRKADWTPSAPKKKPRSMERF